MKKSSDVTLSGAYCPNYIMKYCVTSLDTQLIAFNMFFNYP